ncbi:hypothetical protein HAX54_024430 [Datura stramonium]|uniref:Uncharacterized protein n=1 Tax=Datura stramonium TaxID=4076 RepID=A0ABS8UY80_DATST|nr:hypothetical protein [Datura stramonium]
MIKPNFVLVLSLLATLLLSQYCKTSAAADIPPSTSKPPSQTPQICCPKTQDITIQIKRRARFVPVTPHMGARPRSRSSSSSTIGKQTSSLQFLLALAAMLEHRNMVKAESDLERFFFYRHGVP